MTRRGELKLERVRRKRAAGASDWAERQGAALIQGSYTPNRPLREGERMSPVYWSQISRVTKRELARRS